MTSAAAGPERVLRGRLAVLGLALFVYLTAEMFPVGALPEVAAGLDVRASTAGLLLAGYAAAAGVAAVPVVLVLSSVDRRRVLAGALLLLAGSQVGLALAPSFEVALAARAVAATAHGYVWAVVPVVAAGLAPPGSRGRATAAVFLGSTSGLVVGGPLTAAVSQTVGWRAAAAALAVAAAGVALLLRRVLPPLPPVPRGRPGAGDPRPPVRWRAVAVLCIVTAAAAAAHYVSYTFLSVLVSPVGIDGAAYTGLLAAYGVAGLAGVLLVGRHLDRARRLVRVGSFAVLAGSLALLAPVVGAGAAAPVVVVVLVWAAAFSTAPAVLQDAVLEAAPRHQDTASAAYVVAFQVGIAGGSALGAAVLDARGASVLPVVSAALAGAALVLVARGSRRVERPGVRSWRRGSTSCGGPARV